MYQHIPSADTKVNLTEDDFSRASGQTGQQEENNTGTQETQRQKGSKPEIRSGNGGAPRTGRGGQTGRLAECAEEGDARCTTAQGVVVGPQEADSGGKPKTARRQAQHGT